MDIDQAQSQMLGEGIIPLNVHSSVGIDGLRAAVKDRPTCPRSPSTLFPIRTADIGQSTRVLPTVTNALASDHGNCTLDVYPRASGILVCILSLQNIPVRSVPRSVRLLVPTLNEQNTIAGWIVNPDQMRDREAGSRISEGTVLSCLLTSERGRQ